MKQKTRELLVTTKAAQNWQEDFDNKVEELMQIVSKVDNDKQVNEVSETLDVYHATQPQENKKRKKPDPNERPFEFLVFRN